MVKTGGSRKDDVAYVSIKTYVSGRRLSGDDLQILRLTLFQNIKAVMAL